MLKATDVLKTDKSVDNNCLSAESFKHADNLCVFLCMLFNSILCHPYLLGKLTDTVIVDIIKDNQGDLGSKIKFRAITLTTIMSNLLDCEFEQTWRSSSLNR